MKKLSGLMFAVGLLAGLIAYAPATLVSRALMAAGAGDIVLANVSGTVWSGDGTVAMKNHDGYLQSLGKVRWQMDAFSLLRGKGIWQAFWNDASNPATVTATFGQVEVRQLDLVLPAWVLGTASDYLHPMKFQGMLYLHADQLQFSGGAVSGNAVTDWKGARSGIVPGMALGDYRINLQAAGSGMQIGLSTLEGDLRMSGQGKWQRAGGLTFSGSAQAVEGKQEQLAGLLAQLGPKITPGVHRLVLLAH